MTTRLEHPQKVRILLAYDGSTFNGWQKQKSDNVMTIQGTLEKALSKIFSEEIKVVGAGRTDAKVHAVGQNAHFWAPKNPVTYRLSKSLQALTPPEIVIRDVWVAPDNFHALASAEKKIYKYFILNRELPNPFRRNYMCWIREHLDVHFLNTTSTYLIGTHDFKSFQNVGTDVPTTIRTVYSAAWKQRPNGIIEFTICADGFLKQMARNIVGTSLYLALKGHKASDFKEILASKQRSMAKNPAPPEGLYLYRVKYPNELDNGCRRI